jgi:hypothetical protein
MTLEEEFDSALDDAIRWNIISYERNTNNV